MLAKLGFQRARRSGDFREALLKIEQVLAAHPNSVEILSRKSSLLLQLDDPQAGLDAANKALEIGEREPRCLPQAYSAAKCLRMWHGPKEAYRNGQEHLTKGS